MYDLHCLNITISDLTQAGLIGNNNSPQNKKGSKSNSRHHGEDNHHSKKSKDKTADQDSARQNGPSNSSSSSSLSSITSSCTLGPADLANDNAIMEVDTFIKLSSASAKQSTPPETQSNNTSEGDGQVSQNSEIIEIPETQEEAKVRLLKEGLSSETGDIISVGDIFLIMGKPEKFTLRYGWLDKYPTHKIADFNENVTNMLRRLVHLAKLEYGELIKKSKPAVSTIVNL